MRQEAKIPLSFSPLPLPSINNHLIFIILYVLCSSLWNSVLQLCHQGTKTLSYTKAIFVLTTSYLVLLRRGGLRTFNNHLAV